MEASMGEVVEIEEFKKRRLSKAEADFARYLDRADAFQREGKDKFAREMLDKAKEVRKIIDRLRKPSKAAKTIASLYTTGYNTTASYNYTATYPSNTFVPFHDSIKPAPENN
jgi:hypothetical protein